MIKIKNMMEIKKILILIMMAVFIQTFLGSLFAAEPAEKLNVVVIISDDHAYHDFGFMGHPMIQTPNIDKLASESLVFTRGYVSTALCAPALASLQTGMYPHRHGWTGNDPVEGWGARQQWIDHYSQQPQLPALLAEQGYLSLHTGKYWQGDPKKVSGFTHSMGETLRHGSKASLGVGRDTMQPIYDFIEEARGEKKPFLVWYAPFLPHTPHTPPDRLYQKYKGKTKRDAHAKYFAMVDWLDETCGDLMQYLDDNGLRENTMVMYINDNGWPHGDESSYRGHKMSPWEQGVRTPIMVRWPGKVKPRMDETNLAINLDIAVTALAAAGIPVPKEMDGINLLDDEAVKARDSIFIEDFDHDMVAPDRPEDSLEARGIISGDWKLVDMMEPDNTTAAGAYLFNLKNDPKEKNNLAGQQPHKVIELRKKLNDWWNPKPDFKTDTRPDGVTTLRLPFRTVGDVTLDLKVWWPPKYRPISKKAPAMVLFHGGGWGNGDMIVWNGMAPFLAKRGLIVVTPNYRTSQEHGTRPKACLVDTKSAMRFVREHAKEWGIDATRIAAGGGSAGGHLAAAAAFCPGFNAEGDDLKISCKPDALFLMSPVIDNGPGGFRHAAVKDYWEDFSPLHNISSNPPPTLYVTGDKDGYVPIETAHKYKAEMEKQGGRCNLVIYEGEGHGYSPERGVQTQQHIIDFFESLGYIKPVK